MNYARMRWRDYCRGYYLVTIVTSPQRNCLSRIVKGKVELAPFGEVVLKTYLQMGAEALELNLVICAIMPDHFHAVVVHRRITEVERQVEVSRYLDLAREGALLIGVFISPGERDSSRAETVTQRRLEGG